MRRHDDEHTLRDAGLLTAPVGRAICRTRRDYPARLHDDLLRIWNKTGCTIVMVTHNTTESVYLSNRVVAMAVRPGRIGSVDASEPYPRTKVFRLGSGFSDHVRQVSALLDDAFRSGLAPLTSLLCSKNCFVCGAN